MFNRNAVYGFVVLLMAGVHVMSSPIAFSIPDEGALRLMLCCAGKYPPNNAGNIRSHNDCVANVANMYAHAKGSTMYAHAVSQLNRKLADSPDCFQTQPKESKPEASNPSQTESKAEGSGKR